MRMIQVCNVGDICGGTAACAWTIFRAFPDCQHTVLFFSNITTATKVAFDGADLQRVSHISRDLLVQLQSDVVIFHNTPPTRVDHEATRSSDSLTIQYHHSHGARAAADVVVACSKWLADQLPNRPPVLYQAVTQAPPNSLAPQRQLESHLTVGRLCSPQQKKWPKTLVAFYQVLAAQHATIQWEFVGAPPSMQPELQDACGHRAVFHNAGSEARKHLSNWHVLLYHHPDLTESFGRTVAEAMRAKCVPIVDARGGFLEQIQHTRTGYLCHTLNDFSTALAEMSSISKWFELSRSACRDAEQRFSLRRMRTDLLRLFHETHSFY